VAYPQRWRRRAVTGSSCSGSRRAARHARTDRIPDRRNGPHIDFAPPVTEANATVPTASVGATMSGQTSHRLPGTVRVRVAHFPAASMAVPTARAFTTRVLRTWGLDDATVETARLLVSELTANATKAVHPDDVIALRLTATGDILTLEVWDGNDSLPVLRDQNLDDEGGRGLFLIDTLSTRWAWYSLKTGGKVIWVQIAVSPRLVAGIPEPRHPLPRRTPTAAREPEPAAPVALLADPELLQRVADRLRTLDDWYTPRTVKRTPVAVHSPGGGDPR
jgi:anti-sigma regulatory factor (Ser/Thr protein kinase)